MVRIKLWDNHFCVNYSFSVQLITFQKGLVATFCQTALISLFILCNLLVVLHLAAGHQILSIKVICGWMLDGLAQFLFEDFSSIQHWLEVLNTSCLPLLECFSPSKTFDWKAKTTLKMWIRPNLNILIHYQHHRRGKIRVYDSSVRDELKSCWFYCEDR